MLFQGLHDLEARAKLTRGAIGEVEVEVEVLFDSCYDDLDRGSTVEQWLQSPVVIGQIWPRVAGPVPFRHATFDSI